MDSNFSLTREESDESSTITLPETPEAIQAALANDERSYGDLLSNNGKQAPSARLDFKGVIDHSMQHSRRQTSRHITVTRLSPRDGLKRYISGVFSIC